MRHQAYRAACRNLLEGFVKTSTAADMGITAGQISRNAGSFEDDNICPGDEITLVGFGVNSGVKHVTQVSPSRISTDEVLTNMPVAAGKTITVKLPVGLKLEGRQFEPKPRQTWLRESYKPLDSPRLSIGPFSRIKDNASWMIDIFYPIGMGTTGVDSFADALITLFYPGRVLAYNGRVITVVASSRNPTVEEPDWIMAPVTVRFFATTINPA